VAKAGQQRTGRQRRHRRVRKRVSGTAERPRLCVFRSLRYIYAQLIDDEESRTLAAADSRDPEVVSNGGSRCSAEAGKAVGKALAERAKAAGIARVVFDRGGYLYHGGVKAVAEGAREAGLEF
jgi:large subunit ribosomal protein L18